MRRIRLEPCRVVRTVLGFALLFSLAPISTVRGQNGTDYSATPIDEIAVKDEDGSFILRDVQLIGRGVPEFKAKAINGLNHDWGAPVFTVVYEGHDLKDPSKRIRQSFVVEGKMCGWPKGGTCALSQELDFPLFFIEKYEFKFSGGTPMGEIAVEDEDGSFTLRDVQLIGRGVPEFKAKVINGLNHDWDGPVFTVVYQGHDLKDPSKRIRQSFVAEGKMYCWREGGGLCAPCNWPKSGTCWLSQELHFPLFFVEKCEFKLTGGIKKPTDTELEKQKIERQEQEKKAAETQAKTDAAEAARQKQLAAERKRRQAEADARDARAKAEKDAKAAEVRLACTVIYRNTADRKISDLTVKEEQQVRACQALGLYPPH